MGTCQVHEGYWLVPYFLRIGRGCILFKFKAFDDVKQTYGEKNLVRLVNLKQIVQYAKMQCQPVWIDEGYDGKLVAYYIRSETEMAWNYWKSHRHERGKNET